MAGGMAPSPWITGAVAFVLGIGSDDHAAEVGLGCGGYVGGGRRGLPRPDHLSFRAKASWSALHTLSLAAGAALAYGIHAFTQRPLVGGLLWMRISNTVFSPPRFG